MDVRFSHRVVFSRKTSSISVGDLGPPVSFRRCSFGYSPYFRADPPGRRVAPLFFPPRSMRALLSILEMGVRPLAGEGFSCDPFPRSPPSTERDVGREAKSGSGTLPPDPLPSCTAPSACGWAASLRRFTSVPCKAARAGIVLLDSFGGCPL